MPKTQISADVSIKDDNQGGIRIYSIAFAETGNAKLGMILDDQEAYELMLALAEKFNKKVS